VNYFPSPISIAERMRRIECFVERVGKPAPSWGYAEWCISNGSEHSEIVNSFTDIVPRTVKHVWSAPDESFGHSLEWLFGRFRGWSEEDIATILCCARFALELWRTHPDKEKLVSPETDLDEWYALEPSSRAKWIINEAKSMRERGEKVQDEIERLLAHAGKIQSSTPKARKAKSKKAAAKLKWVLKRADEIGDSKRERLADRISSDYKVAHPGEKLSPGTVERMLAKHRPIRSK
jgi:hypothetical protein